MADTPLKENDNTRELDQNGSLTKDADACVAAAASSASTSPLLQLELNEIKDIISVLAESGSEVEEFVNKKCASKDVNIAKKFSMVPGCGNTYTVAAIEKAMQRQRVTEPMIHIAGKYSQQFYAQVVEAFAQQCIDKDEKLKAVAFLVLVGKYEKAIHILIEKKFHKKALALAKMVLPPDSPLWNRTADKW